jgi:AcrR family transcriptional regulator
MTRHRAGGAGYGAEVGSAGSVHRRVRLDADDRRDQILAAANRLFAERPYSEVSTTDLAVAAGTTRTNLHYYFRTKRELFLEVLRQFGQLPPPPAASRDRLSAEYEVNRLFARWLDVLEVSPQPILTLVKAAIPGADPDVEELLQRGQRAWQDRLMAVFDVVDNGASRAALRSFQGLVSVAVIEWLERGSLTKEQVRLLLTNTLLAIVRDLPANS